MKAEFLRPKFDGARFAEHTLPLEIARDLAAYETLIIELAKHLYLRENPARRRVSKGFSADFHLHLESVEQGSAIPVLAVVAASLLPLAHGANPYFERARDLVAECVGAAPGKLPEEFPRELLGYFNQIGRSLRDGESLQLGQNAVLTPQRRKELVLAAYTVYEREIELTGIIAEADWEKSTFRLRQTDGSQTNVPMPEAFHASAREYGGRTRYWVTVKGVGSYNEWEKLQKVIAVESLDIQPHYQLTVRFEALGNIENGWYEGRGVAPDKNQLVIVAEKFLESYPETLVFPTITPTPEGNLLFEWNTTGSPSVDLDLSSLVAEFHAFGPDNTDIEQDFSLSADGEWVKFFTFLADNMEPNAE